MKPTGAKAKEPDASRFDLDQFLPYLLNQAAEATSSAFQESYRSDYGMTRTQWRVLANLGKFGTMTAREICLVSHDEKTKVSRAVSALEQSGLLVRQVSNSDRRAEILQLTPKGLERFVKLGQRGLEYNGQLRELLGNATADELIRTLRRLIVQIGTKGAIGSED